MGNKYLYTVPYKDFFVWDVKRYSNNTISSYFGISTLGQHIQQENHKVVLSDMPNDTFDILGISNEVGMFDAYSEVGSKFNQPYKMVKNGWIAYNPYRVNVGSIGLKTDDLYGKWISPAYVVFSCKGTLVPEFLFALMKTDWFNKQVRENTSGSVRQNLTFDALSKIKIPVPPIEEQISIVNDYMAVEELVVKKEIEISSLKYDIDKLLCEQLGISKKHNYAQKEFISVCNFKDVCIWGVEKNLNQINSYFEVANFTFTFGTKREYLKDVFRGKSPLYKDGTDRIILNQKCNRWDEIDIRFAKTVDEAWFKNVQEKFFLRENDIIINSTGEGTIGRASLVNSDFAGYLVDSHILVLRLNHDFILPAFIVKQINSEFGQKQIELLKGAQATKQTELGIDNLLKMRFVLPSDKDGKPDIIKQNEIVALVNNVENQILALSKEIDDISKLAQQEFEKAIFANA